MMIYLILIVGQIKLSRLTCKIRAGLCVKWGPPHNDLMSNDCIAVDITFLRHPIFTKVLWGCP